MYKRHKIFIRGRSPVEKPCKIIIIILILSPENRYMTLSHNAEIPLVFPFLYSLQHSIKGLFMYRFDNTNIIYYRPPSVFTSKSELLDLISQWLRTLALVSIIQLYDKFKRRESKRVQPTKLKPHRLPLHLVKLFLTLTPNPPNYWITWPSSLYRISVSDRNM